MQTVYNMSTSPRISILGCSASSEAVASYSLSKMKTYIYIDGFNLFHGALRKTPYRWLNLYLLAQHVLPPDCHIEKIKYFTARVSGTPEDPTMHTRQDIYLRAITTYLPQLDIYYGYFQKKKTEMLPANANSTHDRIKVIKLEEKGSDVNLAVHLINDAWKNVYDCAAIISNDSDLAEAMRLVKQEHSNKKLILVTPSVNRGRSTSKKLAPLADSVRHIDKLTLAKSILPDPIPGTKIHKPIIW